MRILDLLRMSSANLWKKKVRTLHNPWRCDRYGVYCRHGIAGTWLKQGDNGRY